MKKIKLEGQEYNCPESWDDITLKQQIKVSDDAHKEEHFKIIALLSGYCGIPKDILKKIKYSEVKKLFAHLEFIGKDKMPEEPITEFEFKGQKYTVMETLMKEEFQDWVSIETAFQHHKEKMWNALPMVIAVLAKKEGESLDDFDVEKRAKEFEELPISIANRLGVFFYLNARRSNLISRLSLNPVKILDEKYKEVESSIKSQVGGAWYIRLLRGTLLRYIKYLKRVWTKHFTSSPSTNLKERWKMILERFNRKKQKEKQN